MSHPTLSITPANQRHINQHRCQAAWGRESAFPPSVIWHHSLFFFIHTNWWVSNNLHRLVYSFCLHHVSRETRLDHLSDFFSLTRPVKVENWLQVIWRRSYLLLTEEWHHNGAAGVQLPLSPPHPPPPSLLSSAFTWAFTDKLRLMTKISKGTCLPSNITRSGWGWEHWGC